VIDVCATGFLKTGPKGSVQGNFGLMDIVAALHWLRENAAAFGFDPDRITLFGHATGAALVHLLSMAPSAKGECVLKFRSRFGKLREALKALALLMPGCSRLDVFLRRGGDMQIFGLI
jgi:Carboxylesterase family